MSLDFSDYIDAVSDDSPFETLPVSIEEFTQSDEFLHLPPLSKYQYTIIRASSQIYKKETLVEWLGEEEAESRWKETKNEIVLQLGKGCHAPYTPVFNAKTRQWQRIDSMAGGDNEVVSLTKEGKLKTAYATESFYEGTGPMYRVCVSLGVAEDVYEDHRYWAKKGLVGEPEWLKAKGLTTNHYIAAASNPADDKEATWTKVENVEYIGEGAYWTLTEPEHGNYVGNKLVSSNSGKGLISSVACAYVVYLLMCLKDPAAYYGKPSGDDIAILNIAINAAQAKNVFFRYFSQRIKTCPWFANKFDATTDTFSFPSKSISVYSGHSEREAFEGLNLFFCVLDEISGFALESTTGHEQAKTASSVYKMYRASVSSRFPEYGKLVLLSFPRFLGDFIQQKYNQAVAEKEVITREHKFKIDPELPDGSEGNEFTIEWEEDKVLRYTDPRTFVLKRPTWEVNPTVDINKLVMDFKSDPIDALSRFACMPPEAENAFFKSRPKIEAAFSGVNLIDNETGVFDPNFKPVEGRRYSIHVDLAQKHDRCAVALSHVEKWVHRTVGTGGYLDEIAPFVKVDFVRWWTPTKTKQVDLAEVRDFIVSIQRSGFNIALTTFDRWNSTDMINYLNQVGMKSEVLSVAKKHYTDMALLIMEERIVGPEIDILINELLQLQLTNKDKVDHVRRGGKDLSDSVCGSIFNAIAHTPREVDQVVEVHTLTSFNKENKVLTPVDARTTIPIQPPKTDMPKDLYQYLSGMRAI